MGMSTQLRHCASCTSTSSHENASVQQQPVPAHPHSNPPQVHPAAEVLGLGDAAPPRLPRQHHLQVPVAPCVWVGVHTAFVHRWGAGTGWLASGHRWVQERGWKDDAWLDRAPLPGPVAPCTAAAEQAAAGGALLAEGGQPQQGGPAAGRARITAASSVRRRRCFPRLPPSPGSNTQVAGAKVLPCRAWEARQEVGTARISQMACTNACGHAARLQGGHSMLPPASGWPSPCPAAPAAAASRPGQPALRAAARLRPLCRRLAGRQRAVDHAAAYT